MAKQDPNSIPLARSLPVASPSHKLLTTTTQVLSQLTYTPSSTSTSAPTVDIPTLPTQNLSSIEQWGIEFFFSGAPQCGQFANGDWFVVGPVSLSAMTPTCSASVTSGVTRIVNGAMINPDPSTRNQGYDTNGAGASFTQYYVQALNRGWNVTASSMLTLSAGESLIKVKSEPTLSSEVPSIRSAAVLTCLSAVPTLGSFRPPYVGSDKTINFTEADIVWSSLRELTPMPGRPPTATITAQTQRLWLDQIPSWITNYLHPIDAMPWYGRDLSSRLGVAMLMCHTAMPILEKRLILINIIQKGIDYHGILENGGFFRGNGGHGSGRKGPIVFAAKVLESSAMSSIGADYVTYRDASGNWDSFFGEDHQTFIVTSTSGGLINYGYGGYDASDIGLNEWGFAHTDTPSLDAKGWNANNYRRCCTANAWNGQILAIRMLGAQSWWNDDVVFDYLDRYWTIEPPGWQRSWDPWAELMWSQYRPQF